MKNTAIHIVVFLLFFNYSFGQEITFSVNRGVINLSGQLFTSENSERILLEKINDHFDYQVVCRTKILEDGIQILDTINFGIIDTILLIDLNFDGFDDIVLKISDHREMTYCYIFNPKTAKFKTTEDLSKFGEFIVVDDNNFYFYARFGCADNYWNSHKLIFRENNIEINARIDGNFCGEPNEQIIRVYHFTELNPVLVAEYYWKDLINSGVTKFSFIANYWKNWN